MADRSVDERKRRGAWYTPPPLIDVVLDGVLRDLDPAGDRPIRVLDPACGDGRFLVAIRRRLADLGLAGETTGCDVDPAALRTAKRALGGAGSRLIEADALVHDWGDERFDLVIGNPPFVSQMAAATTRGGASRHGGGPYAGTAAEFLSLAIALARPDGGRVGLVLPQAVLGARDVAEVREHVARAADLRWSWWEPRQRHFDAAVHVCAIGLERPGTGITRPSTWTRVVTDRLGLPPLATDRLAVDGTLGDRADLNANFRDEYYALVPAVGDDVDGPPLVTSGAIDPGRCLWGSRPVRFAKRDFLHPRVDLSALTGRFPAWAERKLVPKVLIANQTRVIEAVVDPEGAWLPGVPVTTATPRNGSSVWEIAAVLTSPVASIVAWQSGAGTGLATTSVRVGPATLALTPWPAGPLAPAIEALQRGDVRACGRHVTHAHGLDSAEIDELTAWWCDRLPVPAA